MIYFTHNLKLSLINTSNNQPPVNNEELLQEIMAALHNKIYVHMQQFNGYEFENAIEWKYIKPNVKLPENMGYLFAKPLYDFDALVYEHTYKTLEILKIELELPQEIVIKCLFSKIPESKR
jgi:hypothetical protein